MKFMLIDHIDRPVPVNVHHDHRIRSIMLRSGLLRNHPQNSQTRHPQKTALTIEGRRVVCVILGHHADALVEAELHGRPITAHARTTLNALQRLRQMRAVAANPAISGRFPPKQPIF